MTKDVNTIYVARIVKSTASDGVGLRNSLYVSGCDIKCPGCHNHDWWDMKKGSEMAITDVFAELNEDDFNISILGGEPLLQYDAVLKLCKMIKKKTNKTIWLWSGHKLETIRKRWPKLLYYIDVLVDGPFQQEFYEPNLEFRGSRNQRIINVKSIIQK
nr:MAG TPA: 4Fe-4S single cluster domain protein [Bacteriophage sp.]